MSESYFCAHPDEHKIFGLAISRDDAKTITSMLQEPRSSSEGVGLVVTPNLHHIVNLRHDSAFAQAYQSAVIIVCDGFPVRYYAILRGIHVQRVTGCDIVDELMHNSVPLSQRLFFVVDSDKTAIAVRMWAKTYGIAAETAVPPLGFENDFYLSENLSDRIRAHRTTILIMGVGAPKSEVWVWRHQHNLPPCWSLCVGQAVRVALGLTRRAPRVVQTLHGEWLWRICQEPRRLARRYMTGSVLFLLAIVEERIDARLRKLAWRQGTARLPEEKVKEFA